ncbi:tetratricopeptide repeat protein [Janthinobacterium sp. J1-1]|uniref:tetratricopeptide repeat protein n=1 Tax=Janthinobacterium sp. J1-1 TaxID=3065910 RepID=UPI00281269E6|nr:tetratricopeptide repeat protein [Janthinobacterium sp. J1-1]
MSLLMQALKKAERAKQNSLHEEELDKPSEAYDQVLELAPADAPLAPSAPLPPVPEFTSGLSLEPLHGAPAAAPEPPATPPPPQAEAPQPKPRPAPAQAPPPSGASRKRTPPRAPVSVDPATVRLGVLLGILLLVVCAMAYWYWRASSSPGAGANLPGVPMPLTDAPGTAGNAGPMVIVPPANNAPASEAFNDAPAQTQNDARQGASAAEQQAMIQSAVQQAVAAQLAQMPPPALPPVMAPNNQQIQVLRNDTAPQINPGVQQGYQALASGQLGAARQQYEAVLQQDPVNRDALLGLAAVAQQGNQGPQAAALYLRLLEMNPDDGVALAGLIGLRQGDLVQSESRLKAILARTPESGPVLFALGNVYAQQRRWPEAQQQFFRAYSAVPGNADYAYNLAIGLDRLNQPKLAATYYQRALTLAQTTPSAFDRAAAQQRLGELGGPASSATPGIVITRQE